MTTPKVSEKKITSGDIKVKVDEAQKECWNLIVDKVKELGIAEDHHASWIFAQRVCNVLWLKANPQAQYIIQKNIEEKLEVKNDHA